MTLALIVLIVFLIVWLNQKANIKKKQSQRSRFVDITPKWLPQADEKLEIATFNKWFKLLSSELDGMSFPAKENFILYDLISLLYKKYNVPKYSRYDTLSMQSTREAARRSQAKQNEAAEYKVIKSCGSYYYANAGFGYYSNRLVSLHPPYQLIGQESFNKTTITTEDDFIEWVRNRKTNEYSILHWGLENPKRSSNTLYIQDRDIYLTFLFYDYWQNVYSKFKDATAEEFEENFYKNLPALTRSKSIFLLPETLSLFIELVHQCTRKELKELGYMYSYKSQPTSALALSVNQINTPTNSQPLCMAGEIATQDEKWENEMKARKAYLVEFPWDD